eukprot:5806877-Alexandrium_andersonii.AAC.1
MSASLVGSEMCIRDRSAAAHGIYTCVSHGVLGMVGFEAVGRDVCVSTSTLVCDCVRARARSCVYVRLHAFAFAGALA